MNRLAVILSALAVLSLASSSLGTRGRWWHFRAGLGLFALSGLLGALALFFGVIAWTRGSMVGAGAAITGAIVLIGPLTAAIGAVGKPMIHDISTDQELLDENVAAKQREAYPDIKPLLLEVPPTEAFSRARAAATKLGWQIVSARPEDGIIEATDQTGWFGFIDDVTVRIRPSNGGSRIDVRSTSRVGKSDVGMNAKRIREFMAAM
jgi:uncharacterized protein (DUF1499 family)